MRYLFDENLALFSYDSKIHLFFQQVYCRQHCFYAFGFILCFDWTDQELRRSCLICVNKLFKLDLLILQLVVKAFTGKVNHLSFKSRKIYIGSLVFSLCWLFQTELMFLLTIICRRRTKKLTRFSSWLVDKMLAVRLYLHSYTDKEQTDSQN